MPRTLLSDDGITRVYQLTNDAGAVTGTVSEPVTVPADAVNRAALEAQAIAAFLQNRANITRNTSSIAVANPTNAQVVAALKDALGQLSQLEAQNNAIMRLLLGLLDGTN